MKLLTRLRALLIVVLVATAVARPAAADPAKQLRIGYQKIGLLLVLKGQHSLEQRFAAQGIDVSWVEFPSGPPLVEALNAGSIDIGYVGDTPPIFAQASGVNFVYVASVPNPGQSNGILVRDGAGIKTLADLRGKKIAVTKGSSAQNVLVQALAKAGVAYADVQPIYLQPPDAGAALRNGSVDAWSIWDPFFALGEKYPGVHTLTDARGVAPSNAFFIASRSFATQNPSIVSGFVDTAQKLDPWIAAHQADVAQVSADASGVDLETEKIAVARGNYDIHYVSADVVRQEQAIADTFAKLGLLPQPVVVSANVWSPPGRKVADAVPSR
jgi:sulfonate transport system substrate-binding protein